MNFHIPNDSEVLASILLEAGPEFPPLWQGSIDIFDRLGMSGSVLQGLLQRGHFYDAVRMARSNPSALADGPRAVDWWNACVTVAKELNDLSIFVLLARLFEELPVQGSLPQKLPLEDIFGAQSARYRNLFPQNC